MELLERTRNAETGEVEELWYDTNNDRLVVNTIQDISDVLEANKQARNTSAKPVFGSEVFNKVASIPNIVVAQWLREDPPLDIFNPDHQKRLRARLNSREYLYLRSMEGKL